MQLYFRVFDVTELINSMNVNDSFSQIKEYTIVVRSFFVSFHVKLVPVKAVALFATRPVSFCRVFIIRLLSNVKLIATITRTVANIMP